jgi:hypothetical protein
VGFPTSASDSDAGRSSNGGSRDGAMRDSATRSDAGFADSGRSDAGALSDSGAGREDAGLADAGAADAGDFTCPAGTLEFSLGYPFCIERDQSTPLDHPTADAACAARGLVLCTGDEFDTACPSGELLVTDDNWEWVADLVDPGQAEKRIVSACGEVATNDLGALYQFRCCLRP